MKVFRNGSGESEAMYGVGMLAKRQVSLADESDERKPPYGLQGNEDSDKERLDKVTKYENIFAEPKIENQSSVGQAFEGEDLVESLAEMEPIFVENDTQEAEEEAELLRKLHLSGVNVEIIRNMVRMRRKYQEFWRRESEAA